MERFSPYLALRRPVPTGASVRFLQGGVLSRREQTRLKGLNSDTGHMHHIHSRTGARNECPGGIKILPVTTALILAVLLTGCSLHCSSLPRSQAPNLRIKQLRALP